MSRRRAIWAVLLLFAVFLVLPMELAVGAEEAKSKPLIYDDSGLLSQEANDELNALANQYGARRETDIIIVTSKNTQNADVQKMTEDFYDNHAPGYDKPHGNAVILTVDMRNREVYLAGFYKAKEYLDDARLDKIRNKISPYLTEGDYERAFRTYIQTANKYMGIRPGANPDNPLFNGWFQLAVSLVVGAVVVGVMAYRSGGRVTVTRQTYEDASTSGVLDHRDQYLHTTTTRQKNSEEQRRRLGRGRRRNDRRRSFAQRKQRIILNRGDGLYYVIFQKPIFGCCGMGRVQGRHDLLEMEQPGN